MNEGTFLYDLWRDSPVPMTMAFYIFDLENEEQFLNGEKARLVQRGPFVYKLKRETKSNKFFNVLFSSEKNEARTAFNIIPTEQSLIVNLVLTFSIVHFQSTMNHFK